MSRIDSFHLPPEGWQTPYRLDADQSRHLVKVLRLGPGARVRCFDGQGREGDFEVMEAKGRVELGLRAERMTERPCPQTWLALGWNKSARRGWLFEKAVELGAAGILFWEASRSQGGMPDAPKESWQAQLVAGAKQCGNPWLPQVECVRAGGAGLVERLQAFEARFLLWEAAGQEARQPLEAFGSARSQVFVLGPEGGLEQAEADAFITAGFAPATLGPRPLRWETAALLCLGLSLYAAQADTTP